MSAVCHIVHRFWRTLVSDADGLKPRALVEQFTGRERQIIGITVRRLVALLLHDFENPASVLGGRVRRDGEAERQLYQRGDRSKIFQHVVREIFVEIRIAGESVAGIDEQRVTVRLCARHIFRCDRGAGPRLVLHQHRLLGVLAQLFRRNNVPGCPRRCRVRNRRSHGFPSPATLPAQTTEDLRQRMGQRQRRLKSAARDSHGGRPLFRGFLSSYPDSTIRADLELVMRT